MVNKSSKAIKSSIFYSKFEIDVNNQDLYKLLAFFTMVIDHVGLYLYPENLYLRAIGRFSAPIWLFYFGFNYKDKPIFKDKIFYGALFLLIFDHFIAFAPNILITMLATKVIIKKVKPFSNFHWFLLSILSSILYYPSKLVFDYGTLGLMTGFLGFIEKNKDKFNPVPICCCFLQTVFTQLVFFNFNVSEAIVAFLSILFSYLLLYKFELQKLRLNWASTFIIRFFTRFSLYLYCLHLVILALLKKYIYG